MLVELLAAAVAVVLTIVIVVSELRGPPRSGQTSRSHPPSVAGPGAGGGVAAGPRSSVPPPREAGNLLEDPSFEVGLGRWRAGRGARLDRAAPLAPPAARAAELFAQNLAVWRADAVRSGVAARAELDRLAGELAGGAAGQAEGTIAWELRQLVFRRA